MNRNSEVVIIGAGIMGASLAYFLSKEGKKVLVLEQGEIGGGTSCSTAAWLWFSDKRPEFYGKLAKKSMELYRVLEKELDADCEITFNGSLDFAHNEEELEGLRQLHAYCLSMGYDARMLSREELHLIEPALSTELIGGCLVPTDGHVNPFLLVNAYIQAAKRLGAEICTRTKVTNFVLEGNCITKLITDRGEITPGLVICATGIYSRDIGAKLGLDAHVLPERGFCIVTEKLPPILHYVSTSARQTKSGNIVFGFVADNVDADFRDRSSRIHGIHRVVQDTVRDYPALKNVGIIRSYTGIRCKPEDKFPIVGPTVKIENFWFHLSHSAFAVSCALSEAVAEVVAGKRELASLSEFLYTRFY